MYMHSNWSMQPNSLKIDPIKTKTTKLVWHFDRVHARSSKVEKWESHWSELKYHRYTQGKINFYLKIKRFIKDLNPKESQYKDIIETKKKIKIKESI